MRLLSLTVRNYRLHREQTVEFDPERNLIGGPNESGKSTLAEAIHRALFFRHRSGGAVLAAMKSDVHPGHPEVRLVFEAAGQTWTLEKRFSGNNGTARLSSSQGATLQGDAAEEQLAKLVGNPDGAATTANQLVSRWSHLWVWQGLSGTNPSAETAARRDELIQRLQEQGLAAVMQSELDEAARRRIAERHEEIFTAKGAVKAGSKLDHANKALAETAAALEKAGGQARKLESAARELAAAEETIAQANNALPPLRVQLTSITARLDQAAELNHKLGQQAFVLETATQQRGALETADSRIRTLRQQAEAARNAIQPAEEQLQQITAREAAARQAAAQAEAAHRSSRETAGMTRLHLDLANARVSQLEKSAALDALKLQQEQAAHIETTRAAKLAELAKLPPVTPQALDALLKLDRRITQQEAALAAISAGVELLETTLPVTLDGRPLAAGTPRTITHPAEIRVGDSTVLRVRPGGGASLAEAQAALEDLRHRFTAMLGQLAVSSARQATESLARRQALEQEIKFDESKLTALQADRLPSLIAAATDAHASAGGQVDNLSASIADPPPLPATPAAARAWQAECAIAWQQAGDQERQLLAESDALRDSHREKDQSLQTQRATLETRRMEIATHENSAAALENLHGEAPARAEKISAARTAEDAAQAALQATRNALAELNPDLLENEKNRLSAAIARLESSLSTAQSQRAAARALLARDGTADPEADLLQARARHALATETHAREQRHADAIALLHRLFADSQTAISESLTQPIADRVADYLACLFGQGVRVHVDLTDPAKPSIRLNRPGEPGFTFDSLSGGTREQVAAAVRLATAEILASSHDGCLPVLFDDAFAFADPRRVQSLQSMLYLASTRGLQLIVLTCTPADYTGLGARELRLVPSVS